MPTLRATTPEDGDLAPLEDRTQDLALHSKRTERRRKKLERRAQMKSASTLGARGLLDLPLELLMAIVDLLRPSDIFVLCRVNTELRAFFLTNEAAIARRIVKLRYPTLERCFPRPVLMQDIDVSIQPLLQSPYRPDLEHSHRVKHQNIPAADCALHCTCLTCTARWNALCAAVDFSRWQDHLDKGEPIPTIPHGALPSWNQDLLAKNRRIIVNSLTSPLWYARILEAHLDSSMRTVHRLSQNKADQRPHFRITDADVRAGTDSFLDQEGPPTVEYPYTREAYYMMEVFLPLRSWVATSQRWVYGSQSQEWHDMDLEMLVRMNAVTRQMQQPPAVEVICEQGNTNLVSGMIQGVNQHAMY